MRATIRLAILSAFALFLGGCEEKRPAKTTPPAAATAPELSAQAPPPAAPDSVPSTPEPKPDPVPGVIAEAEREYQKGRAEHEAGDAAAAKASFERALSSLMQAQRESEGDARLSESYTRIAGEVQQLEAVAKAEEEIPEQKAEPAPIDEPAETTFTPDPETTEKAKAELETTRSDLPLMINEFVAGYIDFFTRTQRGRNTLTNGWQRAGRYKEMILRVLKEEGVPQDLFYLAQAESGFKNVAISRVGARGMWQFMHYTAPIYGLKRSWWVDERQDPEKSTRAAARHLKDLFKQFGDWYLAMAAYNSGAGNVQRGVQRTGYADFWELYKRNVLPRETKNYVPIIVAMTIIAKNPEQYGLSDLDLEPAPLVDVVMTDYAVDLRLAAEAIDVPVTTLSELNPSLLRLMTPKNEAYELKLPAGTKDRFEAAMAAIPADKRTLWRYHTVAAGETLSAISRKYRVAVQSISEVNSLDSDNLPADAKLIIPIHRKLSDSATAYEKKATRYKVRKGDTISSIASDFGVPAESIRRWNGLKGDWIRAGRTIRIYKPLTAATREEDQATPARKKKSKKPATATAAAGAPAAR